MRALPTQAVLREWFHYDPATGIFVWKKEPHKIGSVVGRVAGTNKNGYVYISVFGFGQMAAHRLAWIYVHGLTIGGAEIDHCDGGKKRLIFLGYFHTAADAHAAYAVAADLHFGEFARAA